jgi:hypothetical protein
LRPIHHRIYTNKFDAACLLSEPEIRELVELATEAPSSLNIAGASAAIRLIGKSANPGRIPVSARAPFITRCRLGRLERAQCGIVVNGVIVSGLSSRNVNEILSSER